MDGGTGKITFAQLLHKNTTVSPRRNRSSTTGFSALVWHHLGRILWKNVQGIYQKLQSLKVTGLQRLGELFPSRVDTREFGLQLNRSPCLSSWAPKLCFLTFFHCSVWWNLGSRSKRDASWLKIINVGFAQEFWWTRTTFWCRPDKELIKYKGIQIAQFEIERLLVSHPEILDADAIPYLDSAAAVVPKAYIVRASNSLLNEVDVQKLIEARVAPFKRLHQVTFFSSVLKSGSG